MKCAHCNNDNYLHVSASKDRLFYRFLLRRCLRCHYCGYRFFGTDLAPIWHRFGTDLAPIWHRFGEPSGKPDVGHRSSRPLGH
jgi:hypothetical protein